MSDIADRARRIKERVSLFALVKKDLGQPIEEGSSWAKWYCPVHRETDPSFTVHKDTDSFFCYGSCGVGGDVIRYVEWRLNLSPTQAIEHLENEANISAEIVQPKMAPASRKVNAMTWQDVVRYHSNREPGLAYFKERGVQTDTFDSFWLGARIDWRWTWKNREGKEFQQHCWRYTIPNVLIVPDNHLVRGIIMRRDDRMCQEQLEKNPGFRDMVLEHEVSRGVDLDRAKENILNLLFGPKYWKTPGHKGLVFNAQQLVEWREDKWETIPLEYVLIQESQMDTLVTVQEGYAAIQAKIGSGLINRDKIYSSDNAKNLRTAVEKVRNVFIIQDADEAGKNYAMNMFKALGRGTVIATPTGYKDSNDVYTRGNFNKWMLESGIPRMERTNNHDRTA